MGNSLPMQCRQKDMLEPVKVAVHPRWDTGEAVLLPGQHPFYPQVVLPRLFRPDVMRQMPEGQVGGHFGVEHTVARLQI